MKKELKKVSVIVPIYNTEKYINRCINSIISQTYKRIEIILINDGSTDNSFEICSNLSKTDNRIFLYTQKNKGVSAARNLGIEYSTGDYIIFVDSDDFLDSKMIEILVKNLEEKQVDISICNSKFITEDKKEIKRKYEKINTIFTKKQFIEQIYNPNMYFGYPWNKLLKRNLIFNIKFNEDIYYGEDTIFYLEVANNINNVYYDSDLLLYNYMERSNSATLEKFNKKKFNIFKFYDYMLKYTNELSKESINCLFQDALTNCILAMEYLKKENKLSKIEKEKLNARRKKYANIILNNKKNSFKEIIKTLIKAYLPYSIYYIIKGVKNNGKRK